LESDNRIILKADAVATNAGRAVERLPTKMVPHSAVPFVSIK